jgi:hypothetical protein
MEETPEVRNSVSVATSKTSPAGCEVVEVRSEPITELTIVGQVHGLTA